MNRDTESLWDDIQEGIKWKPILPLLKAAREAPDGPAKLVAIRDVAAFVLRTLTGKDPYHGPAFATFALVVELAQTDPRVAKSIARMLPPA
jgi:hypothetical protein